eukprot:8609528-Lingulodinium_polyedra.AAC.1
MHRAPVFDRMQTVGACAAGARASGQDLGGLATATLHVARVTCIGRVARVVYRMRIAQIGRIVYIARVMRMRFT